MTVVEAVEAPLSSFNCLTLLLDSIPFPIRSIRFTSSVRPMHNLRRCPAIYADASRVTSQHLANCDTLPFIPMVHAARGYAACLFYPATAKCIPVLPLSLIVRWRNLSLRCFRSRATPFRCWRVPSDPNHADLSLTSLTGAAAFKIRLRISLHPFLSGLCRCTQQKRVAPYR